ncbi:Hypothetical predicted protein, partial [Paramuricea clavata]
DQYHAVPTTPTVKSFPTNLNLDEATASGCSSDLGNSAQNNELPQDGFNGSQH